VRRGRGARRRAGLSKCRLQAPSDIKNAMDDDAFPSLGAALQKKKKKPAKGVKMAFGEFLVGAKDERALIQSLPKAPRGEGETPYDDRQGFDRGAPLMASALCCVAPLLSAP